MCPSLPAGLLSGPVWGWLALWRLAPWSTEISRWYYAWGSLNLRYSGWPGLMLLTHIWGNSFGYSHILWVSWRCCCSVPGWPTPLLACLVFFGHGRCARQCHPSPRTHTHTNSVFGSVRSAVTNADFPVSVQTQNVGPTLLGSSVSCPVILRKTSISFFVLIHSQRWMGKLKTAVTV